MKNDLNIKSIFSDLVIIILGILLLLIFSQYNDFEKYCTDNGGTYLEKNIQCYIDGNYFNYSSEVEKYIFKKNLTKK